MREALQMFTQFCEIMGSLEKQFQSDLAPTDHATPNATQQTLSALNSRGAGLYGVFLRGIIDKISEPEERVPRPVATAQDVFSTRYYKVVQNRTEVYDIVTQVFHRMEGWEELPHGLGLGNIWNLCWTWSKPKLDYSRLCVWQKVNHFPENKHLTRKDCLKRLIDRYTRTGGKYSQYFSICPKTFVLPKECFRAIWGAHTQLKHCRDLTVAPWPAAPILVQTRVSKLVPALAIVDPTSKPNLALRMRMGGGEPAAQGFIVAAAGRFWSGPPPCRNSWVATRLDPSPDGLQACGFATASRHLLAPPV